MAWRWLDPILNPLACLPEPPPAPPVEKAEALLKRLEVLLRHRLKYATSGEQRSLLRGQGLDFAELREYTPGDDIRKIDWNVFARTLTPHVREYHEEKQLTLWLAVDLSPSMRFGRARSKMSQAIDLAGLFGLLAQRAGHKLGGFLMRNNGVQIIPPRSGYGQLQQITQALLEANAAPPSAGRMAEDPFPAACGQLAHLVQKNATVILLSDFLAASDDWLMALGRLSRHTRLLYLMLEDPVERNLADGLGLLDLVDPETGEALQLDTDDPVLRLRYMEAYRERHGRLRAQLGQSGQVAAADTEDEPMDILLQLLQERPPR
jgi:uncharacterized protein (DUF58 family)